MINLRYHIVSITAVFLALGLGLALGSGFLSNAAVDQMKNQIDSAETRIKDTKSENADLRDQVDQQQKVDDQLNDLGSPQLFEGRLADVPVLVLAADGVDTKVLDRLDAALLNAGARYDGTLLLEGRLDLTDSAAADDMAALLDSSAKAPSALRRAAVTRLAGVLTEAAQPAPVDCSTTSVPVGPDGSTSTTGPTPTTQQGQPDLVTKLRAAGFLGYRPPTEGGDGAAEVLTQQGYRYVVVGGDGSDLADGAVLLPLLKALAADGPAPVVYSRIAAPGATPESRTVAMEPVTKDDSVEGRITTVDDLEEFPGIAASMLGLNQVAGNDRGDYGQGNDVDALMPDLRGG